MDALARAARFWSRPWRAAGALGALAAAVYAATASPSVAYGDTPELTAAAVTLGVPHPTGYPLYMLLGHAVAKLLPWGDAAWRLNLLSALSGGAAVTVWCELARRVCASRTGESGVAVVAATGALSLLAFSPVFWAQCTVAEVYALHALLSGGVLLAWLRARERPDPRRACTLAALLGLSFTHHLMTVLFLPIVAVGLAPHARRLAPPRIWPALAACGLAPLLLYAYLPWVASGTPEIGWGVPTTLERFLRHVSGRQFHALLTTPVDRGVLEMLERLGRGLVHQFSPLVALAAWGMVVQARRDRHALVSLGAGLVCALGFALSYRVVDRDPFHLPALLLLSLWIALGAQATLEQTRRAGRAALAATAVGLWVVSGAIALRELPAQDRSDDWRAHDEALAALAALPRGAALFTWGLRGDAPLYASVVEGVRPDVEVIDAFLLARGRYAPELEALRWRTDLVGRERVLAVISTWAERHPGRTLALLPARFDWGWHTAGWLRVTRGAYDELIARGPMPALRTARPELRPPLLRAAAAPRRADGGDLVALDLVWDLPVTGREEAWAVEITLTDPALEEARWQRRFPLPPVPTRGRAEAWRLWLALPPEMHGAQAIWTQLLHADGSRRGLPRRLGSIEVRASERQRWRLPRRRAVGP